MPLIICEINLNLDWSQKCIIVAATVADQGVAFSITDAKIYVPVIDLSTQDNVKLLEKLKSYFKWTINCNEYQYKNQ